MNLDDLMVAAQANLRKAEIEHRRKLVVPATTAGAVAMFLLAWLLALTVTLGGWPAQAHDRRRPDLDEWFGQLRRPGVDPNGPSGLVSCCSRTDCHATDAELRGDDWWARIGVLNDNGDWDLQDWVKVPAEAVLQHHDNPAGEGVICHSPATGIDAVGRTLDAAAVTIWCFIPPTQG